MATDPNLRGILVDDLTTGRRPLRSGDVGGLRGVALYQSADDTALNSIAYSATMSGTGTQVKWSAALYDTDSTFNPATPGVITLPTDISYLNVSAALNFVSAAGGHRRLRLTLNNSVHWSSFSVPEATSGQATSVSLATGWIPRPVGVAQIQINAWQNQTAGTALLLAGADADVVNYGGSTFFRVEFK